ncbi:hypothetical protein PYCH_05540 [Pyrococcus yayanosii CH1]|uniref:Uncharacterized protein n=2 Tax=Pyrococcus TaxID=2260 RepID=F8AIT1_PYRYC|nr:hypothetical protein PYCH_05540 [Pyrococcus yayanosii CH1]
MAMNDERGKPHLVGRIKLRHRTVVDLNLWPVLYEKEQKFTFKDGDEVFFIIPFDVSEGVEGVYLRLIEVLGEMK